MKSMEALIDTNVIVNFISKRDDPYRESSDKVMKLCADGTINGYIAFHSLSILWYLLRKRPDEERRKWLRLVIDVLTVVGADNTQVLEAIENKDFKDFEDCLQYECARTAGADCIITCNIKDFSTVVDLKVLTPVKAVELAAAAETKQ